LGSKKQDISVPAFPLKLLKWLCKPEYHSDIEGDLLELYHRRVVRVGQRRAGFLLFKTANAFFGDRDPINEMMRIDNLMDVKVTGVYADMPHNSQFKDLNFIASWDLFVSTQSWIQNARDSRQWDNSSFQLYVEISDNADMRLASEKIRNIKYDLSEQNRQYKPGFFLHPMNDWHLRSSWENGIRSGGLIQYVWLFGIIGVFVVLLACINFMNLSTARSEKRAREVGMNSFSDCALRSSCLFSRDRPDNASRITAATGKSRLDMSNSGSII
jgi:hypothetical protein